MDKVTQQNAANAEESASASEELSAQAESMNEIVNELASLVGGNNNANQKRASRKSRSANTQGNQTAAKKTHDLLSQHNGLSKSDHVFHNVAEGSKQQTEKPKANVGSAAHAIPLDDGDFEEFNS
jgi:methyl-accepting chemotaxis protein